MLAFQRQCAVLPDVITYDLFAAAAAGPDKWNYVCFLLLDSLHGLVPDVLMLGTALGVFEKAQQWERALEAFRGSQLPIDRHILNAAVTACAAGLQPKLAQRIVKEMEGVSIQTDVVTFAALITAAEKGQLWQDAIALVDSSNVEGIRPDRILGGATISACEKAAQWQWALDIAKVQVVQRLKPNEIMCNAQISACAASGQLPQALNILNEMPQWNIRRSKVSFNSAAEACQKSLDWEGAVRILEIMRHDRIQPDIVTVSLVSSPLEAAGKTTFLPPLIFVVPSLGFVSSARAVPTNQQSEQMTALEILVEHDALSSSVARKFQKLEWRLLRSRLERLAQGSVSEAEKATQRLFDRHLNRYFSLGVHFTCRALNRFFSRRFRAGGVQLVSILGAALEHIGLKKQVLMVSLLGRNSLCCG